VAGGYLLAGQGAGHQRFLVLRLTGPLRYPQEQQPRQQQNQQHQGVEGAGEGDAEGVLVVASRRLSLQLYHLGLLLPPLASPLSSSH
jgi:hypothetical protein